MKSLFKKILIATLFLLVFSLWGCKEEIGTEGLVYELIEDQSEYAVVGYTGDSFEVIIPSTYNSIPVTEIRYTTFSGNGTINLYITGLTLPDSITSIEENALGVLTSLSELRVPKKIEDVGSALTWILTRVSLTIPKGHLYLKETKIDGYKAITSKDGSRLVWIENPSEENITITIPDNIVIIDDYAMLSTDFGGIVLPKTLEEVGIGAFYDTPNTTINIPAGIKIIQGAAFAFSSFVGELVLPEGLEEVGGNAFGSNQLTGIVFPSTITSLARGIFGNHPNIINKNCVTRVEFKTRDFLPVDELADYFVWFFSLNYRYAYYLNHTSPDIKIEIVFSMSAEDNAIMDEAFWIGHAVEAIDSDTVGGFEGYYFATTSIDN
ncbi:MAG: leucine-rich repeat domain-containing protein [Firmicutes bacterium]|nr:leucine-rich repeat domain-containing protein [Bacillota bacterium]